MKILAPVPTVVLLFGLTGIAGAAPIVWTGGTITENFDSIGFGALPPIPGWTIGNYSIVQNQSPPGSAPAGVAMIVDDGSNNTKGVSYNYGLPGDTDRAIGGIATTGTGDRAIQVEINNNTGATVTGLTIGYTLEQWRIYQGTSTSGPEGFELWYSTAPGSGFTQLPTLETFAPHDTPADTPIVGNDPANRHSVSATVAVPGGGIPNGSTFYLTWHDTNETGTSDHGIAIDDFSLAAAGAPPPPPPPTHFVIPIIQGLDDHEESLEDGSMDANSSDLEFGTEGGPPNGPRQAVGLRFQNVDIPQGATIASASIQFTVDETDNEVTNVRIFGELSPDAAQFADSAFNITSRTLTSNSVLWSNIPEWANAGEAGPDQQTPDLTSIVQEIVNQSGWSPGNALAFIVLPDPISDNAGERTAESFEGGGSANQQAVLTIDLAPASAVPEPSTFVLVAVGLLGLGLRRPAEAGVKR